MTVKQATHYPAQYQILHITADYLASNMGSLYINTNIILTLAFGT